MQHSPASFLSISAPAWPRLRVRACAWQPASCPCRPLPHPPPHPFSFRPPACAPPMRPVAPACCQRAHRPPPPPLACRLCRGLAPAQRARGRPGRLGSRGLGTGYAVLWTEAGRPCLTSMLPPARPCLLAFWRIGGRQAGGRAVTRQARFLGAGRALSRCLAAAASDLAGRRSPDCTAHMIFSSPPTQCEVPKSVTFVPVRSLHVHPSLHPCLI